MNGITTCLWFDGNAEEAARFYTSIFPDSRIDKVSKSPADNPSGRAGETLTVDFTLAGSRFQGLNGGPDFKFNESVSFVIDCKDQAEVDRYWDKLVEGGGEHSVCGWLKDRYGVSWQITPKVLVDMMASPDKARSKRATDAMLKMVKIDVAALEAAFDGK